MFVLAQGQRQSIATGLIPAVVCGGTAALEAESRAALADDRGAMLVGALPFDRTAAITLYRPERVARNAPFALPGHRRRCWHPVAVTPLPAPDTYAQAVRRALAHIAAGRLEKVVLARSLRIRTSVAVEPLTVATNLAADPDVTTFCLTLPGAGGEPPHTLVGATPELLVRRRGRQVVSHPLAGSAARYADPTADRATGQALLASAKDRHEHALVVEAILDQLAPHCADLATPDGPALHSTASMWHLGTRIYGQLKPDAPSAAGLAALLHPTPAVGGTPRDAALAVIAELEPTGRGFYAGAVGCVDGAGDGEWHVTLRCADICDRLVTLYAGAGIVAGSNPDAEVAETQAKFTAMLRALEMDEGADLLALAS